MERSEEYVRTYVRACNRSRQLINYCRMYVSCDRGKVKLEPETELTGMSQMLNGLHGYVRQPAGQKQADQIVCLHVTHSNLKQRFLDIRVDLQVLSFPIYSSRS